MSRLLRALLLGWALLLPVIGAAAEPPAILLAEVYRNQVDVTKYLVSEKLDGVRAIWDGATLRFRSGRQVRVPEWFVAGLPKRALDGELWLGAVPSSGCPASFARKCRTMPNGGRYAT